MPCSAVSNGRDASAHFRCCSRMMRSGLGATGCYLHLVDLRATHLVIRFDAQNASLRRWRCAQWLAERQRERGNSIGGIAPISLCVDGYWRTKMRIMPAVWLFACLVAPFTAVAANDRPAPVSFVTSDNVTIFADYYGGRDAGRPLILLFHQAGSNRAEYAPIAPMLVALGFDALAIDQRSGGSLWGHANETVQHLGRQ
jgi:hypothetical protein